MEQYMDFEKRVQQVHKPNRVNPDALKTLTGTKITEAWRITCKADAHLVVNTVVADLQDYFQVSMNLSLTTATADGTVATAKDTWITHPGDLGMRRIADRIIATLSLS